MTDDDGLLEIVAEALEVESQLRERLGFERLRIRELSGERRLLLAQLELVLKDLLDPTSRTSVEDREAAWAWLHAEEDPLVLYPSVQTFAGVCEELAIDAGRLRRRVLELAGGGGRLPRLNHAALGDNRRTRLPRSRRAVMA